MSEADGGTMEGQCCGGHAHAGEHAGHEAAGLCAQDQACSGHAGVCGSEAEACCGGQGHGVDDLFAFPTTTEVVSIPAVQLAGLLDLVEKLAPDLESLSAEVDFTEAQRLLGEQAPQLVALRDAFLERMKGLLTEMAGQAAQQ